MIQIFDKQRSLLRVLPFELDGGAPVIAGVHRRFGVVTKQAAQARSTLRQKAGLPATEQEWDCRFAVIPLKHSFNLIALDGCHIENLGERKFRLDTDQHSFFIESGAPEAFPTASADKVSRTLPTPRALSVLAAVLMTALYLGFTRLPDLQTSEPTPMLDVVYVPQNDEIFGNEEGTAEEVVEAPAGKGNFSGALAFLNAKTDRLAQAGSGSGGGKRAGSNGNSAGNGAELAGKLAAGAGHGEGGGGGELQGSGSFNTGGLSEGKGTIGNGLRKGSPRGLSQLVSLGEMEVEEGLERSVVLATVNQNLHEVRGCYQSYGLPGNASLEGRVTVGFEIGPKGSLLSARVKHSSLHEDRVESCITRRMLRWKFPQPMGGKVVQVEFPFLLQPRSL